MANIQNAITSILKVSLSKFSDQMNKITTKFEDEINSTSEEMRAYVRDQHGKLNSKIDSIEEDMHEQKDMLD